MWPLQAVPRAGNRFGLVPAALVVLATISCVTSTVIRHEPQQAAIAASAFAKVAFIEHNPNAAHRLLSPRAQKEVSLQQLEEWLTRIHPTGWPSAIAAMEYEPVPGQKAMNILLEGRNGSETFYYRLYMTGTAPEGYQVSGLFRGNGPYPSKLKKPLATSVPSQ
jgi:hypothetical protein